MYAGEDLKEQQETLVVPLLEDALKMPFTVFTTKHKTKMLKWLHQLTGESEDKNKNNNSHYGQDDDEYNKDYGDEYNDDYNEEDN